ncbi:hypothetical protein AA0472_0859 [Acetobacter estunensis NRIC 0472]|uniref:DUF1275 domain-containing protein n=1 Tax=Acetobacter estunensis TaxID=104097 RepID=A0A967B8W1_9PROT|nr:YoaK family protein [Acetobacter estunensis]NHO52623.1 DUF1275 domain-containing protein [Acetobacter estunensis]GBQ22718.1 hypothetical protein AA0472_0859 [Acetobacter estunensis NRIC 0472]
MLWHEGDERDSTADLKLGCSLSAVAGSINVAGFLAVGFYSANMTGNVSIIASALEQGKIEDVLLVAALIGTFVLGAFLATVLMNAGRRRELRSIHAWSIMLEAGLLAALGVFVIIHPQENTQPVMVYGFSFLMGLQNATVTRISNARVRTTHVTGLLTDIGTELADWLGGRFVPLDSKERRDSREKLRLHAAIVLSFVIGGTIGAVFYTRWHGYFLVFVALFLAALVIVGADRQNS